MSCRVDSCRLLSYRVTLCHIEDVWGYIMSGAANGFVAPSSSLVGRDTIHTKLVFRDMHSHNVSAKAMSGIRWLLRDGGNLLTYSFTDLQQPPYGEVVSAWTRSAPPCSGLANGSVAVWTIQSDKDDCVHVDRIETENITSAIADLFAA